MDTVPARTTITDVRTVAVQVTNQDAAVDFYRDTLGFDVRIDGQASPTMRWIEVAPPGAAVTVALVAGDPDGDVTITGIGFEVPDAARERAWMAQRGVDVDELLLWSDVPPMFKFYDLDGNQFGISEAVR